MVKYSLAIFDYFFISPRKMLVIKFKYLILQNVLCTFVVLLCTKQENNLRQTQLYNDRLIRIRVGHVLN